jgi:phage shock protein PspC (stress-responsive transcriptional regulator)
MQRISITARLNRTMLQFEEPAYARLENYFADASATLEGNPDKAEILADLEQAVADQCSRRMQVGQTVVTLAELQPALDEIGAVQLAGSGDREPRLATRQLRQISEGAVISGVCQGLSRYFDVDVTLLRVIAVVLLFVSGGMMIVVYLFLMLLLPFAPLDRSHGARVGKIPMKCREFVGYVRGKLHMVTT